MKKGLFLVLKGNHGKYLRSSCFIRNIPLRHETAPFNGLTLMFSEVLKKVTKETVFILKNLTNMI